MERSPSSQEETILGWIADGREVVSTSDRGNDETVAIPTIIARIRKKGVWLAIQDLAISIRIQSFTHQKLKMRHVVKLNFEFAKGTEYLVLRTWFVHFAGKDSLTGLGQFTLERRGPASTRHRYRQMLHDTTLRMTDVDFDRVENDGDLQK